MNARLTLSSFLLLCFSCFVCGHLNAASTGTLTVKFGQTTEDSFKATHPNAVKVGFNNELKGNIYQEKPNSHKDVRRDIVFEGLEDVFVLFDQNKNLIALQLQFKSDYFGIIAPSLDKKYTMVTKKQSISGSNYLELYNDGVSIYLSKPAFFSDTALFFIKIDEKEKLLKSIPNSMLENEINILNYLVKKCFSPQ
ncbi:MULTISPECIES: hypothetical protein [unclassified Serratia (in: enterobacteria)]|uniref:hypothetical protein n=1 Tax=unclassified Serratia (in: enterobacteria) TaxID=2647522 RepID=UPI003075F572